MSIAQNSEAVKPSKKKKLSARHPFAMAWSARRMAVEGFDTRKPPAPVQRRAPRLSPFELRRAQQDLGLSELRKAGERGLIVERFAASINVSLPTALTVFSELEGPDTIIDIKHDGSVWRARLITEGETAWRIRLGGEVR